MNYADEIRRQAEAAPRAALPAVAVALWKAFGEGHVSEAEAETLTELIEARRMIHAPRATSAEGIRGSLAPSAAPQGRQSSPRTGIGSRPRTDASLTRRRRWAASGRLPPALAARFTPAEQAVLALVAAETARRRDCRLAVPHIAAVVGVAETTVRNAIREARRLGLVTIEERRLTGFRNDTNVVRIVSAEWLAWLRLARKPVHVPRAEGGGCKSPNPTPTQVPRSGKTRPTDPQNRGRQRSKQPTSSPSRVVGA